MNDQPTERAHIIVKDAVTGIRRYVHEDLADEALRINAVLTPKPFDLSSIHQHPGRDCCDSCMEDAAYDVGYSLYPQCCCRSEVPIEWLEARLNNA